MGKSSLSVSEKSLVDVGQGLESPYANYMHMSIGEGAVHILSV